jgi:O-antigen/teichoic acid export membrane protein
MRMFGRLQSLLKNPFIRNNLIFLMGSVLVGGFNYIYYPILGRMLSPEAYGEVQAMVALCLQLLIFLNVLSQVSINVVANYTDEDRKQRVIFELEKLAFMASLGIVAVGIACSWYVKDFFNFESVWPFIVLLSVVVATVPLSFRSAFLRAHLRFGIASISNIIGAAGKVIFSVILVWLGFNIVGAIGGILVAQVVAFTYTAYKAKQLGFMKPADSSYIGKLSLKDIRPELPYAAFMFVCSMSIVLLSSIDIFVVKHYFDPLVAGQYAGISTVARIIFFLTAPLALVLLPAVKIANSASENRKLLLKSLGLLVAVGGSPALFFAVFPDFSVHTLMGSSYAAYTSLLPLLCLAMLLLSVVNLIISYYIALRNYMLLSIIIPGVCTTVILMWASHSSVRNVVMNLIYGSIGMIVLCVVWRGLRIIRNWSNNVPLKENFSHRPRI